MNNFDFHNPTRLIFGKGTIAKLGTEIPSDKRIMVCFGGGSAKKNGVYEQVKQDGGSWANVSSRDCGNIVSKAIEIANRSIENK